MLKNEPTLCLHCTNFPCTCGDQYKDLTKKNLLTLINHLLELAESHYQVKLDGPTINHVILPEYIRGVTEAKVCLLGVNSVYSMPKLWQNTLTKYPDPKTCLTQLLTYNTENYLMPSTLASLIVYVAQGQLAIIDVISNYIESLNDNYSVFKKSVRHAVKFMSSGMLDGSIAELREQVIVVQRRLNQLTNPDSDLYHEAHKNNMLTRQLQRFAEGVKNENAMQISNSITALLIASINSLAVPDEISGWVIPMTMETESQVYYIDQAMLDIIKKYTEAHPINNPIPLV